MFEELEKKEVEIMFDEWPLNKWFKLALYDIRNDERTKLITKEKCKYYCFYAQLEERNPFMISRRDYIKIYISKGCFDKEIIRHINFKANQCNGCDIVMWIRRTSKYKIQIKHLEKILHKTIGDNIFNYVIGDDEMREDKMISDSMLCDGIRVDKTTLEKKNKGR